MNTRETAVRILLPVLATPFHLRTVWNDLLPSFADPRDRAFVQRLVLGVLRRLSEVDCLIAKLSRKPLERLDPEILWVLRCAVYELLDSNTPRHAVLYEWVKLCRTFRKSSATAFVNGVLREHLRNPASPPSGNDPASLAIRFSHPEWLVRRYLDRHGLETTRKLMSCHNSEPDHFLWVNPFRTSVGELSRLLSENDFPCYLIDEMPGCVRTSAAVAAHPLYKKGLGMFIDVSSQWIARLPDLEECRCVADLCAAPGGKAFLLASRLPIKAHLIAADVSAKRLRSMNERINRLRIPNISLAISDQTGSCFRPGVFDFILLDVPCSGLGTLAANPDIRWRFQPQQLARLQAHQLDLLRSAFSLLEPGRELLYSTCSTEPEENEEVIAEFQRTEAGVAVLEPCCRTSPLSHGGQAFFAARLRRE